MPEPQLTTVTSPFGAWQEGAYLGTHGDRPALVLLGARSDSPAQRIREHGWCMQIAHPAVLPLLSIEDHHGRPAWVYEHREICSLAAAAERRDELLPIRAAVQAVARSAEILSSLGDVGLRHPGPEPTDLLIGTDGDLYVANFGGPLPQHPSMRPPGGETDTTAAAYRHGVLLATLLVGTPPPPASDPGAHAAMIRRVLIRAIARPGPHLPERLRSWIETLLAWDAGSRPALSQLVARLREVADGPAGPTLEEWAAQNVLKLATVTGDQTTQSDHWYNRSLTIDEDTSLGPMDPTEVQGTEEEEESQSHPLGALSLLDDLTAESDAAARVSPRIAPRAGIPVTVGPPVASERPPPSLPQRLFQSGEHLVPERHRTPVRVWAALIVASALLVGITGTLLLLLLWFAQS